MLLTRLRPTRQPYPVYGFFQRARSSARCGLTSRCAAWLWVILLPPALFGGQKKVIVHSDPEGANVTLVGELQPCKPLDRGRANGATPCTLSFDNDAFNPSGGLFVNSKMLGVPLQLAISMKGYQPKTITTTDGPHTWRAKDVHAVERTYYFIKALEFHVQLDREISSGPVVPPALNPTSPASNSKVGAQPQNPVYGSFRRAWLWVTLLPPALLGTEKKVFLHSDPEGANVVLAGELQRCKPLNPRGANGTTPCTLSFDNDAFNPSGGLFENSKILGVPLQLLVSMKGYQPKTITITDGPHTWKGKDIRVVERTYYFIKALEFRVRLDAEPRSVDPLSLNRTPPVTFETKVGRQPPPEKRQPKAESSALASPIVTKVQGNRNAEH